MDAVTDIAGIAVAEKDHGGFCGQREKPPMELCSVGRFKVYGLILQTHLIRGHIKIGLGMEYKKVFNLRIKADENNDPQKRNQDD